MGVVELTHFFKMCKSIWMGLEDAQIFWLVAKQMAFFGIHDQFGDMVVDHYNWGLDIII